MRSQVFSKKDSAVLYDLRILEKYIDSLGIKEKAYVMAQAAWETGWFNCKDCAWSIGHNAFGFRSKKGYIKYESFLESVVAYSVWQNKKYTPYKEKHPKSTYIDFLEWCGYAETKLYRKHVLYAYNKIVNYYGMGKN